MMRYRRMLAVLAALMCRTASAQSETSGTVMGTVVDPSGAVVRNVTVDLRNAVTGFSQSAATDSAGVFRFNNVPRSKYQLEVAPQGFRPVQLAVEVTGSVPVVVTLNVEMTEEHTTVEVTASAALIDTSPGAHYGEFGVMVRAASGSFWRQMSKGSFGGAFAAHL